MGNSRLWSGVWGCLLAPVLIGMPLTAWAAEAKPSIKDIMVAAHKKAQRALEESSHRQGERRRKRPNSLSCMRLWTRSAAAR